MLCTVVRNEMADLRSILSLSLIILFLSLPLLTSAGKDEGALVSENTEALSQPKESDAAVFESRIRIQTKRKIRARGVGAGRSASAAVPKELSSLHLCSVIFSFIFLALFSP